jgi:indole-3-glycerol phosphate synthase
MSAAESPRVTGERSFSHAIAEGDGISVVAAVEDVEAARAAEMQRAEALVVVGDPGSVREATALPILWRAEAPLARAAEVADAVTLALPDDEDGDHEGVRQRHEEALALGLDCAVEVRTEEELERALELLDPEIFLLAPPPAPAEERLEAVLDLLAEVPAGKLAIADLVVTTEERVHELERAGVDAVIVHADDVSPLAGEAPPDV